MICKRVTRPSFPTVTLAITPSSTRYASVATSKDGQSDERYRIFGHARPIGYLSPEGIAHV